MKITFVNGRSKCGCTINFSDGEGMYSNIHTITLCAEHEESESAKELNKHLDLAVRKAEGVSEALRRKLEAAEAELAALRFDFDVQTSELASAKDLLLKWGGELDALRGAAVPVAEIKMFPFPGCKFGERRPAMAWVGKQDKDFPVGTKFYTHPAPPVVVLPEKVSVVRFKGHSLKGVVAKEHSPERIIQAMKDAGITVKFADSEGE